MMAAETQRSRGQAQGIGTGIRQRLRRGSGGSAVPHTQRHIMIHYKDAADIKVAVIGYGPEEAPLKAQAHRLGIAGRVDFIPSQSQLEIAGWMRRAKLFVLPSLEEALGIVLLEAQASGLTGNVDDFWPDLSNNAWHGGTGDAWERGPYFLDGLVPL